MQRVVYIGAVATSEPGLTPHQLEAWVLMLALFETVPPAIEAQLKADAGINLFEYTVLAMLSEEPDRTVQMTRLADISFGSISRLSHAVTRLERRGWVDKQRGHGSRRHNTVSLTDEGYAALVAIAPAHVANARRLLAEPLTDAEIDAFARVARKLVGAAEPAVLELLERQIPEIIERNRPDASR